MLYLRKYTDNDFVKFPLRFAIRQNGTTLWTRHKEADVAAMRLTLPQDADIRLMNTRLDQTLATDDTLKSVMPGDQVLMLGFPFGVEANEAGFLILRSARVISYPLVPMKKTKTFLLDCEVFEGNSGGPVLLYTEWRSIAGPTHIAQIGFIMGVVSRQKGITETTESLTETVTRRHRLAIAEVVHAGFVSDLINTLPSR